MQIVPVETEGYNLLHEGALALSDLECNGIRIDVEYCEKQTARLERLIKKNMNWLNSDDVIKKWRKKYPQSFSLESNEQLTDVLFNEFDYEPVKFTDKGNPAVDEEALKSLGLDLVDKLLRVRKLSKAKNTYLKNLIRETHDEFLHPSFNLNIARTFRSSSSNPNFQNIPIRDPEIGKIIRNAIRAREGHCLVEIDYGGIEVKGAHWYHADPVMEKYLFDPESDMHGDMAQMIFKLDSFDKKVSGEKTLRKGSKNGFVFPQFYGDYYKNNAASLWNWAGLSGKSVGKNKGVQIKDGVFISENLKNHGIRTYKQFEDHLKNVEDDFWNRRFKVYNGWKKKQIKWYQNHGYVSILTGFVCQGVMRDNAVTNYPIQGASFHCLLWALIHVNKKLKRKKMKTKLVGQIHDSIIADVPENEVDDFIDICKRVMCHKLKNHWDFITTPLEIEIDKTPVGGTWFEKETILEYRN